MIATADIGRVAAELLQQTWSGRRIVEIEGPHRVTPEARCVSRVYPLPSGLTIFATEITARKQAETEREQLLAREQAERANRIKDQLLE